MTRTFNVRPKSLLPGSFSRSFLIANAFFKKLLLQLFSPFHYLHVSSFLERDATRRQFEGETHADTARVLLFPDVRKKKEKEEKKKTDILVLRSLIYETINSAPGEPRSAKCSALHLRRRRRRKRKNRRRVYKVVSEKMKMKREKETERRGINKFCYELPAAAWKCRRMSIFIGNTKRFYMYVYIYI